MLNEKSGQKADLSKTFNNSAALVSQFQESLLQPQPAPMIIPGTVKQYARQLELGPGSSFRNLTLNNSNEAAAGLLQSIGGVRKGGAANGAGSTFSVNAL